MQSETTYTFSEWELGTIKQALEVYEGELAAAKLLLSNAEQHYLDNVLQYVSSLIAKVTTAVTSKEEYAKQAVEDKTAEIQDKLYEAMNGNA